VAFGRCWFESSRADHGGQARLGERRTPNPVLQRSIRWSPAKFRMPKWSRRVIANHVLFGSSPKRNSNLEEKWQSPVDCDGPENR
jgi:hypothetical protein